jgi:hypothetical protein
MFFAAWEDAEGRATVLGRIHACFPNESTRGFSPGKDDEGRATCVVAEAARLSNLSESTRAVNTANSSV